MRQDEDSEIIDLSMKIRNGATILAEKKKDIQIYDKNNLTEGMLLWADQIICATNATRININMAVRRLLKFNSNAPQIGDKIINLNNEWDIISDNEVPLVNGTIGKILNIKESYIPIPAAVSTRIRRLPIFFIDIETDMGEKYYNVQVDKNLFLTGEETLNNREKYLWARNKYTKGQHVCAFTFAYAITCHKSQRK